MSKENRFQKVAWTTVAATYFLIFVGGLVRVAGAGLGCPDWPRCFGRWIPPTSLSQLPAGFDPASFNMTLAWIEYVNRLIGVAIGLLILATAVMAIRHFRDRPPVVLSSVAALVLVIFQGWLGGQVVATELQPAIVSIHMLVALLIVSLLIFSAGRAGAQSVPLGHEAAFKARRWAAALWVVMLVQIILGTQVRGELAIAAAADPAAGPAMLLQATSTVTNAHATLGTLSVGLAVFVGLTLLRSSAIRGTAMGAAAGGFVVLSLLQLGTGAVLKQFGLPDLAKLFHLLIATLLSGLVFYVYVVAGAGHRVDTGLEQRSTATRAD